MPWRGHVLIFIQESPVLVLKTAMKQHQLSSGKASENDTQELIRLFCPYRI